MNRELIVRKEFLEDFAGRIIKKIVERNNVSISLDMREITKREIKSILSDIDHDSIIKTKIIPVAQLPQNHILPKPFPSRQYNQINTIIQNSPVNPLIKQIPPSNPDESIQIPESMKKIVPFIKDIFVQSIECKGPDTPLLVLKGGIIQVTNIVLSKEEIDLIMQEISNQTRIPLMQGLFKALLGQLIITGAISDFVGTRFILEKRRNQKNDL